MSPLKHTSFTFRKVLFVLGVSVLILFIILYIGYQSRSFIQGPSITLVDEHKPVQHSKMIVINGATKNIVELTVNGKEIHTDEHGTFAHRMILENGYTITTFTAKDRFGRTTTVEREYVYVPMPQDTL